MMLLNWSFKNYGFILRFYLKKIWYFLPEFASQLLVSALTYFINIEMMKRDILVIPFTDSCFYAYLALEG